MSDLKLEISIENDTARSYTYKVSYEKGIDTKSIPENFFKEIMNNIIIVMKDDCNNGSIYGRVLTKDINNNLIKDDFSKYAITYFKKNE